MTPWIIAGYLVVGLAISRTWYRRKLWPSADDGFEAALMVFGWPFWLVGWPLAKAIKWLYTA